MSSDRFIDDKATIRAELLKRARVGQTITYGEMAQIVGRANQGLGSILDAIKVEAAELGRPDLGCLVVSAYAHFPSYVAAGANARFNALAVRKAVFRAHGFVA